MTDPNAPPPIIANPSPARDQAEAAIRGVVLTLRMVSAMAASCPNAISPGSSPTCNRATSSRQSLP